MRFRPCIDLHDGQVKQIVGGTLTDADQTTLVTNFVATQGAAHFAAMYRRDGLLGGHLIMLGPGNDQAAKDALAAYPGGLQIGGGITIDNAATWLDRGAAKLIVTSHVFRQGQVDWTALARLTAAVGQDKLVLDLSCRRRNDTYLIVTDRWQRFTETSVDADSLATLARHCSEFLVHAVDLEGLRQGVDQQLVQLLATDSPLPVTYAGGIRHLDDLLLLDQLGAGRVDATVGSSLDIFGGNGLKYADAVAFDQARRPRR